jgi:hypothetical protein
VLHFDADADPDPHPTYNLFCGSGSRILFNAYQDRTCHPDAESVYFAPCGTCSVVDQHRLDADPDFHVDADPEPDQDQDWYQNNADPSPSFTHVGKSDFLSHRCHFTVFYLSHQCQMCHMLLVFWSAC